jgi:hypothetical protein
MSFSFARDKVNIAFEISARVVVPECIAYCPIGLRLPEDLESESNSLSGLCTAFWFVPRRLLSSKANLGLWLNK